MMNAASPTRGKILVVLVWYFLLTESTGWSGLSTKQLGPFAGLEQCEEIRKHFLANYWERRVSKCWEIKP